MDAFCATKRQGKSWRLSTGDFLVTVTEEKNRGKALPLSGRRGLRDYRKEAVPIRNGIARQEVLKNREVKSDTQ